MYYLKTENSFDAAHFLSGYVGKCANLHGHRWKVEAQIKGEALEADGEKRGMLVDFSDIKTALKEVTDWFDHSMIYEKGSLQNATIQALQMEGFLLREVAFRPTAENFAKYFYKKLEGRGYAVHQMVVYETPNNCAVYEEA